MLIIINVAHHLLNHSSENKIRSEAFGEIFGSENIKNKVKQMIESTQARIYLLASSEIINNFKDELLSLAERNIKIVILSDGFEIEKAKIYKTEVDNFYFDEEENEYNQFKNYIFAIN